jgi:hypothetical protein
MRARAWLNCEKSHDTTAFEKVVADDWIAITPDGKSQTKAERAAEIKASHTNSATMGDMKVRVFGDTAVVRHRRRNHHGRRQEIQQPLRLD